MAGAGCQPLDIYRKKTAGIHWYLSVKPEQKQTSAGKHKKIGSTDKTPEFPYTHTGYHRFLDQQGYPAVKPPWGTLNAINLNTGEYLWRVPLGEFAELTKKGIPPTGTENYGGPVVTAGGLGIYWRHVKTKNSGHLIKKPVKYCWETTLPAGGYATPSTYLVNGRQYVVISAGGAKMGTKAGDAIVAFALP